MRSDRLGHTLLPKRIALPVFASDALSSVAYAPDEILLTLALAGVSATLFSPWVGVAVVAVMLTVIASYRQNVHAYPSGGGDYEVATVNLGRTAGVTVASALLVDYVLTVAVSVSAGAQYAASAFPGAARARDGRSRSASSPCSRWPTCAGCASPAPRSPLPSTSTCSGSGRSPSSGFVRWAAGDLPRAASSTLEIVPQSDVRAGAHRARRRVPHPAGVRVRVGRPHRRRGHQQRRARVPQAQVAQRRHRRSRCSARSR